MVVPGGESTKGTAEVEPGRVVPIASKKRKKKAGMYVSIRKGRLLFLPTAVSEEPARPSSDETKARESEGN